MYHIILLIIRKSKKKNDVFFQQFNQLIATNPKYFNTAYLYVQLPNDISTTISDDDQSNNESLKISPVLATDTRIAMYNFAY